MNFVYSLHCKLYIILFRHGNSPYAKIINFVKLLNYHSWSFNSHSLSFIVIHCHSIVKLLYCLLFFTKYELYECTNLQCISIYFYIFLCISVVYCFIVYCFTASCQLPTHLLFIDY